MIDRRTLIGGAFAASAVLGATPLRAVASGRPRSPAIGLGTWITFNVGDDPALRAARTKVVEAFVEEGGGVIDSSPMYGSSQAVVGHALDALGRPEGIFSADKVWTSGDGQAQIAESLSAWRAERFDLLQVHNLVDWRAHLPHLFEMKAEGRLGHVGITTSHGRRHDEMEEIMATHPLDFVQLTYNAADTEAEERLLPLARDRGIAVIANRPFRRGALIDRVSGAPLPDWAAEIGAESWPAFLLKFTLSNPDVACAIPATTSVEHLRENKAAARGPMPDAAMRRSMAALVGEL